MGAGASTGLDWAVQQSSPDELQNTLKDLPPDLRTKLQKALAAKPTGAAAARRGGCPGPVDCGSITEHCKDYEGLKKQPEKASSKGALVEIYVRSQPFGGSDKTSAGHRYDSIPIANALIDAGMSCQLLHYTHEEHEAFFQLCSHFDFILVRCSPGHIEADGGSQKDFDSAMSTLREKGLQVWPAASMVAKMASLSQASFPSPDSFVYSTEEDFATGFRMSVAYSPRVIKLQGGSEGTWIAKLKDQNYCEKYGKRSAEDSEMLVLREGDHEEEHTVSEFLEFYLNGRTEKSGTWTSKASGKYLSSAGAISDERFETGSSRGELELIFVMDELVELVHTSKDSPTFYANSEESLQLLAKNVDSRIPEMAKHFVGQLPHFSRELGGLPIWWSVSFKRFAAAGAEEFVPIGMTSACVGLDRCLPACCTSEKPQANMKDVTPNDLAEVEKTCKRLAEKLQKLRS